MLILVVSDNDDRAQVERDIAEQEPDWQFAWAPSAAAALKIAAESVPDVIVCAASIDSNQGLHLLADLRRRYPDAVRIVLMAAGQDHDILEAMDVGQRILPQPLEALALIEAVESVMELRALLDDPVLKKAIDRIGSLPAAPRQYMALTRLLRDPDCTAARVAEVVAQDPTVAAKVLRLTNSSFYSGGREISDLRTAVTRIGQGTLRRLVLASEVFAAGPHADAMRDRALRISQLAGQLLVGPSSELAATAGLLSEVGLLLPPVGLESEAGAASYGITGAYLLGLWGLPAPIVEAVAFHRTPARVGGSFWVTGAVHVAAALVNGTEVDEVYLRSVGQLDRLPSWRALVSAQSQAADTRDAR